VAREEPLTCTKMRQRQTRAGFRRTRYLVLFRLLPFTTLGWPEKTRDQSVFYPTPLLITAYEILFFWVARMIMFGCHFMQGHEQDPAIKNKCWEGKKNDSVPFRQVISTLRPRCDRQKMSKTKGNVIDPLEIIERFGTDATRFTLAAMAAPGRHRLQRKPHRGLPRLRQQNWNAARFMFMNVDRIGLCGTKLWWTSRVGPVSDRSCGTKVPALAT